MLITGEVEADVCQLRPLLVLSDLTKAVRNDPPRLCPLPDHKVLFSEVNKQTNTKLCLLLIKKKTLNISLP